MTCESQAERHTRPYATKSLERREALNGGLPTKLASVSDIRKRLPQCRAAGVGAFRNTNKCTAQKCAE